MSSTITTTTDNVVVNYTNNNHILNSTENLNKTNQMRNLRVHFGIDEDLRMILEMDPSIIDLEIQNVQDYSPKSTNTKVIGLPPKSGGYVFCFKFKPKSTISFIFNIHFTYL